MRAQRLGVAADEVRLLAETSVERIVEHARIEKPQVMVIDSIQTLYTESLQSAPGSVAQVRESAAQLVRFAKQTGTALFLVGHVTKEGTLAGPRVLEHMVDTVLYFEGESGSRFRVIRAIKNRFGAVNELGVFAMTDKGLKEVRNPSAIFLSRHEQPVAGSVIMVTQEGTRPLLVEVQALVDDSQLSNPRRVTLGLEQNRLAMLLAVLHRHGGICHDSTRMFSSMSSGVCASTKPRRICRFCWRCSRASVTAACRMTWWCSARSAWRVKSGLCPTVRNACARPLNSGSNVRWYQQPTHPNPRFAGWK